MTRNFVRFCLIYSLVTYFSTASVDGEVKIWKIIFSNNQFKADFLQTLSKPDKLLVTALSFNTLAVI